MKSSEVISFYSKLEDFFQSLKDERFLRCHKSFVVNMDFILKIENSCAFMLNNIIIPITNSKIALIREKYYDYLLK